MSVTREEETPSVGMDIGTLMLNVKVRYFEFFLIQEFCHSSWKEMFNCCTASLAETLCDDIPDTHNGTKTPDRESVKCDGCNPRCNSSGELI